MGRRGSLEGEAKSPAALPPHFLLGFPQTPTSQGWKLCLILSPSVCFVSVSLADLLCLMDYLLFSLSLSLSSLSLLMCFPLFLHLCAPSPSLISPFLSEAGGEVTACGVCRSLRREEKGEGLDRSQRVRQQEPTRQTPEACGATIGPR